MSLKVTDEKTLRRYLLGRVSDQEREDLEQWLLFDKDAEDLVNAAEDDLIDEYLSERLKGDDLETFRNHFLAHASRQLKLEFARSLRRYIEAAVPAPVVEPRPVPFWGIRFAFPAMILFSIVAISWSIFTTDSLRRQLASATANLASVASEREAATRQESQYRALESAIGDLATAFTLTPGRSRGEGDLPTTAIPLITGLIQLVLPLVDNDFDAYRVTLTDPDGREVWRRDNVEPKIDAQRATVVIIVPSHVLPVGDYNLSLLGLSNSQPPESISSFSFRTVLQ